MFISEPLFRIVIRWAQGTQYSIHHSRTNSESSPATTFTHFCNPSYVPIFHFIDLYWSLVTEPFSLPPLSPACSLPTSYLHTWILWCTIHPTRYLIQRIRLWFAVLCLIYCSGLKEHYQLCMASEIAMKRILIILHKGMSRRGKVVDKIRNAMKESWHHAG